MNKDPRITAYAVGELQGSEREKFEQELAFSGSLDREASDMFRLATQLAAAPKPNERFSTAERCELIAKCMQKQRARKLLMMPVKIIGFSALGALGAAASLMLLAGFDSRIWFGSGPWANAGFYPRDGTPLASSYSQMARTFSAASPPNEFNTEAYAPVRENEFVTAKDNPLSTFSIDVDTASYSNVRRFLNDEVRPPTGAIRTEELINYFRYNYPQPTGEDPFSVNLEVSRAPWNPEHELVRIGLKGRELPAEDRGPANLVFLIDVSGSMDEPNKLPLLQRSLSALVENLSDEDRVAMVTYAGSSGLVLPPTPGTKKREILNAIANLRAEGSTHGSEGIRSAYETARQNFRKDGSNRVILCTDGDFNVGVTSESELQKLIEKERESGVFLSVLGFGTGNLKDSTMELLANKGNGNYAYIDSISEGRKVLVEQMGSTLFTIAKDVKIQVEFNPARVAGYRLIGYENRLLAKEDFNDDTKDAGEIGAGHTVTALYEIIPTGQPVPGSPSIDPLKYQQPEQDAGTVSDELLTVKLRYKAPDGDRSKLIEIPLKADEIPAFDAASEDFRFAAAVAAFGMKLRGSPDAGEISWSEIQIIVRGALGSDPGSYRAEFLTLIEKAKAINEQKVNE
jgi:Ca-activated chloride channel family protein